MKNILIALLGFAFPLISFSQDQIKKRNPKNEAGILLQMELNNNLSNSSLAGFQYKRWVRPHLAIRALGGYNFYSYTEKEKITRAIDDSLSIERSNGEANMGFAGLGLEVHKKFHKRIYLFAALEAIGGYGTGKHYTYGIVKLV